MTPVAQILNADKFASQHSDPLWLSRARAFRKTCGNYCQSCRRNDAPIYVYNVNYRPGVPIWEAEDRELAMLCGPCHELMQKSFYAFRESVSRCNSTNVAALVGLLRMLLQTHGDTQTVVMLARLTQ